MIAAYCYIGAVLGEPVAHIAVTTEAGLKGARAARLVVKPEWQGIGLGVRFLNEVAGMWRRGENRYGKCLYTSFKTAHPGLIATLRKSPLWQDTGASLHGTNKSKSRAEILAARVGTKKSAVSGYGGHLRATAGFRYVGE